MGISVTREATRVLVDDTEPGQVLEIETQPTKVRVAGSHLYVDVLRDTSPAQVRIKGYKLFLRARIRWNGGTTLPTILWTEPKNSWPGGSLVLDNRGFNEWAFRWAGWGGTFGPATVMTAVEQANTVLTSLQFVRYTPNVGPGGNYDDFYFYTLNNLGNPFLPEENQVGNPADNAICTIVIREP